MAQSNRREPPHDTRFYVSEGYLAHVLDTWEPTTPGEAHGVNDALLRYAGALSNLLFCGAEERAVAVDLGQHVEPVDLWDLVKIHELSSDLIDMIAAVRRKELGRTDA